MAKKYVQVIWGGYPFGTSTTALAKLDHSTSYRHPSQGRIGRPVALQFVGKGDDSITLTGDYYPAISGRANLMEIVRLIANQGKPHYLIDGMGMIYGKYVCTSVKDGKESLMDDGRPQKISFTVQLKKYYPDGATS
ncbi:phage tail protein [Candidatus Albibeggiatoa sp. nov. BB20]|uniref:phage tail protein n=1 Tax=Candidatus Albibeggiatoa sp. nov. BB20 TaxID=3162723 RepID=UPI003365436C